MTKRMSRRALIGTVSVAAAGVALGTARQTGAQTPAATVSGDTLAKVKAAGKVLIGVRNDFPPMGTIDAGGKPVGFGPDLGEILAKKLGVKPEFIPVTSRTRIPLLQNGSIDLEVGVTTPTTEREKTVDFSIPYIWDSVNLLIRKGGSKNIKDYAPPKKIACTQGSFIIDLIKQQIPNAEFVLFQEYPDAVLALLNSKVDAVGINRAGAVAVTRKDAARVDMSEDFIKDPWAIMVRQNDSAWRNWVNHSIQEIWKEGTFQVLFEKHFGEKPQFVLYSPYMLQPGIK